MDWRSAVVLHRQRRRKIGRTLAVAFACALSSGVDTVCVAFRTANPHDATSRARASAVQVQQAIEMYRTKTRGRCPPGLEALKAANIVSRVPRDPWGRAYRFACPHAGPEAWVVSAGHDGTFGTADDIDNLREL